MAADGSLVRRMRHTGKHARSTKTCAPQLSGPPLGNAWGISHTHTHTNMRSFTRSSKGERPPEAKMRRLPWEKRSPGRVSSLEAPSMTWVRPGGPTPTSAVARSTRLHRHRQCIQHRCRAARSHDLLAKDCQDTPHQGKHPLWPICEVHVHLKQRMA